MEALPLIIITIAVLYYLLPSLRKVSSTLENSASYIEERSEVLKPMATLQNKYDLAELQLELDALATKPTKEEA